MNLIEKQGYLSFARLTDHTGRTALGHSTHRVSCLARTWAARFLRWSLAMAGLAAWMSGLALAEEPPGPFAGAGNASSKHAPAPGDGGDDFTSMNLNQLMNVQVPVVYGASKHEQKITEAPASVSIVTSDEIRKHGYRTLKDILNNVRGFYVTYDRVYSFIGVRGVNRPGDFGGRVLITVDGHRMNDPIYDSALSGTEEFLDVDLIDRVEVIRGPGSSLYGNNAFFSVINIITRPGRSVNWGEVSTSAASYESYKARFTLGHSFTNGLEFIVSGTLRDIAGHDRLYFPEYVAINGGHADDLDRDHGSHLFGSLKYNGFTLSGGYNERGKEVPSAAVQVVFNEQPAIYHDKRAYAELKYFREFMGDWSLLGRVSYDYYHFDSDYIFDYGLLGNPADFTLNRDISLSRFVGGEVQLTKTIADKHRLTLGGEFRDDLSLDLKNYDVLSGATYLDTKNDADNFGLYTQGEFQLAKPLTLNAGLRYDHFRSFGSTVNPRAALIYAPFRETVFKALYGQAFRSPNAFEVGYISPTYDANPDLKSESVHSYELVWEQGISNGFRVTGAAFYNNVQDLITKQVNTTTGHFIFRNTDSVDVWGGEVEVEAQWEDGWQGRASYSLSYATDSTTGADLSNSPRHLGKVGLIAPVYRNRVFASIELQAMSERLTVRNQQVSSFATCNATLYSRELVKGLDASVSVYNLFNANYSDPVAVDYRQNSIRQDGRTFMGKLTWRF